MVEIENESTGHLSLFCLDVDGVLTDGTFVYSRQGKIQKTFGPDDSDALKLLAKYIEIQFVTADYRGLRISRRRIEDMGFIVNLVPSSDRYRWLEDLHPLSKIAYMGDSFLDAELLAATEVGIAPANSHPLAKASADYVTENNGGNRAVAEACFYLADVMGVSLLKTTE